MAFDRLSNSFAIFSDTHFGTGALEESALPPIESALKYLPWSAHRKLEQFFANQCGTHSLEIITALPRYLRFLIQGYRDRLDFSGDDFDVYIFAGDHVTLPQASSFAFFAEYLTRATIRARSLGAVVEIPGLNVHRDRLVLVPGNHDKLLHADLGAYHAYLCGSLGLRATPSESSSWCTSRKFGGREFLFVAFDANSYARESRLDKSALRHLARGEVSTNALSEINDKLSQLREVGAVDDATLTSFDDAFKLLVVHYAVDEQLFGKGVSARILPHECAGLRKLAAHLAPSFDLMVHGHFHTPMVYNHHSVPVVSAGTATQRDSQNGFFILNFFESGAVKLEHHRWHRTSFYLDPDPGLTRPLI